MEERINFKNYFLLKNVNSVIKFITMADFMMVSGFGLIMPIFAVFIVQNIKGGSLEVVGLAMTIYLLVKSVGQIPVAFLIDKIKGEKDDFWAVIIGYFMYALLPLFYIFIKTPAQLYIIQVFYGLASAIAFPAWYAIFTRHIDRDQEGMEWGVYNTLTDLGGALAASIGGFIASKFGFFPLFVVISIVMLAGVLLFTLVYKDMRMGHVIKIKQQDSRGSKL